MQLRKIILTIMASATILGVGANIQPTMIHARRVRTSRVRRHRTYRRRSFRRVKRTKHSKRIRRPRRHHQARRRARKHRSYRLVYKASRARKPKRTRRYRKARRTYRRRTRTAHRATGLNKYIYNVNNSALLQDMSQDTGDSVQDLLNKYSTNGKSIKAFDLDGALTPIAMAKSEAKEQGYSLNTYLNECDAGTGKLTQYDIQGSYMTLTPTQLKHEAANSNTSVSNLLNHDIFHANKYMDGEGMPTALGQHVAEQDAINDLNQIRESKGISPLTEDPGLEILAKKRAALNSSISHIDKNGEPYAHELSQKYNLPTPEGENVKGYDSNPGETPAQIGQSEQRWDDAAHQYTRENIDYTKVGIGINPNGITAEEFE